MLRAHHAATELSQLMYLRMYDLIMRWQVQQVLCPNVACHGFDGHWSGYSSPRVLPTRPLKPRRLMHSKPVVHKPTVGASTIIPISWSHLPTMAIVSYTPTLPQTVLALLFRPINDRIDQPASSLSRRRVDAEVLAVRRFTSRCKKPVSSCALRVTSPGFP